MQKELGNISTTLVIFGAIFLLIAAAFIRMEGIVAIILVLILLNLKEDNNITFDEFMEIESFKYPKEADFYGFNIGAN